MSLATIRSIRASPTRSRSSDARPSRADWPELSIRSVTPGYFRVTGLPLVARPAAARRRHDGRAARARDQPGGGGAVLRGPRAARRAHPVLGRRRGRSSASSPTRSSTASPRPTPIAAYAPLAQAPTRRHRRAAGPHGRRSRGPRRGRSSAPWSARSIPALAVFGVEPLDDTLRTIGGAAAIRDAAAGAASPGWRSCSP